MITEEQRKERVGYIGGSDCAAVLGMSRWGTPLSVWAEKSGIVIPEDIGDKLYVKLGNRMEQIVADLFEEETGKKVHKVNETIYHPKHKFMAVNIDRRVVGEDAILECKTCSPWKSKEWEGEEIPREYELQVHHTLAVTGKSKAYIAVLIGNQDFKMKVIYRDKELINTIINKEVEFWNSYVVPKIPPETIYKNDGDILYLLYPQAIQEREVELPVKADALIDELEMFKQDRKQLDGLIDQHENELKSYIKDGEKGNTPQGGFVKWINSKWSGLNGKLLKEELPGIHQKYYKSKLTRRFSYKKQGEAK